MWWHGYPPKQILNFGGKRVGKIYFWTLFCIFLNSWHLVIEYLFKIQWLLLLMLSRFSRVCTLCDPVDGSPPGSSIPGILQARILEWVAISFSNACMHAKSLQSCPYSVQPHGQQPTRLLCPQDSLGKNTGVGCHFLL